MIIKKIKSRNFDKVFIFSSSLRYYLISKLAGIKIISQYPLFRKRDNIVTSAKIFTENELHEIISTQPIIKLNKDIILGCHFHNNCGLALANSLSAIEAGCEIVDATIKGMGRGAGNTETELLLSILRADKINLSSFLLEELLGKFQDLKNKFHYCWSIYITTNK